MLGAPEKVAYNFKTLVLYGGAKKVIFLVVARYDL